MALALHDNPELDEIDVSILHAIRESLHVTPRLPITEWAEQYYVLPSGSAFAGSPYRFTNSPWAKEILSRLDPDDPARDVVWVKPTQVSATTTGIIWAGYTVHQNPTNFLYITGTLKMAADHMTQKIDKLIDSCPAVRNQFLENGRKYGVYERLDKEFVGGRYKAIGTVTPDDLRAMASECEHFDEVDAYEFDAGGEGDPIGGAKDRSETFRYTRKHFYTSTPLQKATSRIWPLFESGDRRRYFVPCPRCESMQFLKWSQVQWNKGDPSSARYQCEICGQPWTEGERIRATQAGEWRGERSWNPSMPRSYHLTGRMYSHFTDMPTLVRDWYDAQERPEKLIHFVHTALAEPSSDESLYAYETDELYARREHYATSCPGSVQYITAGADVQDDRLEMVVVGWGAQEEGWILGHYVLVGDTEQPDVWNDLETLIEQPYELPDDQQKWIYALCIDQRHREHMVAAFCNRRSRLRTNFLWPVKGIRDDGTNTRQDIWPRRAEAKRTTGRARVIKATQKSYFGINTFEAKKTIYARCKFSGNGPNRWHFPDTLGREFFDQFTSEALINQRRGAKVIQKWIVKQGRRNEVLDCMVYAFAALKGLYSLNITLKLAPEPQRESVEETAPTQVAGASTLSQPVATQPAAPPSPKRPAKRKRQPRKYVQRRFY